MFPGVIDEIPGTLNFGLFLLHNHFESSIDVVTFAPMMNINIIRKMLHHIRYEVALEDQNTLLREQLKATAKKKDDDLKSKTKASAQRYLLPIAWMEDFVNRTYEFRHNMVTDVNECRRISDGGTAKWQPVDDRELHSIEIDIQHAGIFCMDRDVKRFVESKQAEDYHPVTTYLNKVKGTWDGKDRTEDLLRRVSTSDYCLRLGRVWLRAVVAQWLGRDKSHANSVMLLLVSLKQGMQKSTFLRNLLPPELTDYYTDDFSLNSKGNAQRKMVEFAVINMDEFDKENPKKMPMLKTLMQTMKPSFIGAYKKNFNRLPRIASFVGTSNTRELLHDRSGSRRFLIIEPDGMIDTEGINHDQLYAQLVDEVEKGMPCFFDKQMEEEIQEHNQPYYVKSAPEKMFESLFRTTDADEGMEPMMVSRIYDVLSRRSAGVMKGVTVGQLGYMMSRMKIPKVHTEYGNAYCVTMR